jgi:hypothetical protein
MDKDEALKLASESLKAYHYTMIDAGVLGFTAWNAVEEALAQPPAQEPLVWKLKDQELGCGLEAHITAREYNQKQFDLQRCYEFIGIPEQPAAQPAPVQEQCKAEREIERLKAAQAAPVAHRDGYWCVDLTCKKCYSADFRFKHHTPPALSF